MSPSSSLQPTGTSAPVAPGLTGLTGLTSAEAAELLNSHGANRLDSPPGRPRWLRFLDQFRNVLVLILAGAAGLAAALGDIKDAVVVSFVLLINAILGYVQEGKAENAMAALKEMLVSSIRARRDGLTVALNPEELVPGDVVLLEAGDRIPADGVFLVAISVGVDESSLTGESVPVDKTATLGVIDAASDDAQGEGERGTLGFSNTTLVRGRAELLVTRTGMQTEIGKVAALLNEANPGPTPLQEQLDQLGKRLALVAGVAVSLVFAIRLLQGDEIGKAAIEAVALAIAAIPEGLPAVVTVTLAVGVHQMAMRNAIVKRLASVETLGSTTVICSDKTGTLTLNQMTATEVVTSSGTRHLVSGSGYSLDGVLDPPLPSGSSLLLAAALANDSTVRDGALVGDPTEGALLVVAEKAGIDVEAYRDAHPRIGEIPFDSTTKFMGTFHEGLAGGGVTLLVKGAPDVVIDRANLDPDTRRQWEDANNQLASSGRRVLALAHREWTDEVSSDVDVQGLTLDALVAIVDPPRPEARDAITLCAAAGIDVKMITGDHAITAAAIAADLGIKGRAITGADLDAMTDEELAASIETIGVCARVSPEHKVRVVRALQSNNHVVAMTGDGVNDAPALKTADIGVAMGITGTEVTKEAADVVLADDNFASIVGAVERGRAIYDNIVKFVRFQLTTNLAAISTILAAGLLGLPAPLTALQVLFVNLIADGPPAMVLGLDPPGHDVMFRHPRDRDAAILTVHRLLRLFVVAFTMAAGTLGVLVYARQQWGEPVALTMTFTTFVFFQLVNVINARSETGSAFSMDTLSNSKLWIVLAGVVALQVAAVTTGLGRQLFDTVALTPTQWAIVAVVPFSAMVVDELRCAIDRSRNPLSR